MDNAFRATHGLWRDWHCRTYDLENPHFARPLVTALSIASVRDRSTAGTTPAIHTATGGWHRTMPTAAIMHSGADKSQRATGGSQRATGRSSIGIPASR